ncbi:MULTISPECIES: 16S rRNA (guanine(1207)-N(2))-methyltransferase RsmC [unclassified Avibacterium]|uniref:16S rRNA (guanine(1207)-N(2))-methyltransferase RsmC n=1 Tax=unclassified Avibacterium TaxID=2685287 RepID=UPI002026B77A|nr:MULTISPECIES: 16S rRNA (guanine(1207)-N(2))-methyltransferase RsmC [unclassified Avibacterium]MCW9699280.1 16S rRNA (guanine(1207)-N(2))-methyltransferase RsmC [Avibacterium sp. 20-129]URL06309.1 16S rRNA (guanine(1207)-N(2))-methyltransferase RsmC [Avibacterium sp. 21-595]
MISPESQVLERHLSLFENRNVLFTGALNDDFPQQLCNSAKSVHCWTWYFDYAKDKSAVDFSVDFIPTADLIVYYWTKNKQENQLQLMQLLSQCSPEQEVLIIGENRSGVRSAEKMLSPFGEIGKIDSARRCGLYHFCLKKPPHFDLAKYWKSYQHAQLGDLTIFSLPGVFSATELDVGTALLISTLDHPIKGRVLDMGCGAGVIGSYIKQHNPTVALTMTDIHALAVASAQRTFLENNLQAEIFASDVFSQIEGKFDLIISNPPFHDGVDTAFRAVSELISQAKWHLNEGGELRIVANAFLPYADLLDQHFGSHQVLAKTNKFKVYSVYY